MKEKNPNIDFMKLTILVDNNTYIDKYYLRNYEVEQEMYCRAVELIETGGNDFDKKYSYC